MVAERRSYISCNLTDQSPKTFDTLWQIQHYSEHNDIDNAYNSIPHLSDVFITISWYKMHTRISFFRKLQHTRLEVRK